MTKIHINPETGNAGPCSADDGNCPFGPNAPHFSTVEDARVAYEAAQNGTWSRALKKDSTWTTSAEISETVEWVDKDMLALRYPNLNKPAIDYGFHWATETGHGGGRVSLGKPFDAERGTLYIVSEAHGRAAVIADEISPAEAEDAWYQLIYTGNRNPRGSDYLEFLKRGKDAKFRNVDPRNVETGDGTSEPQDLKEFRHNFPSASIVLRASGAMEATVPGGYPRLGRIAKHSDGKASTTVRLES